MAKKQSQIQFLTELGGQRLVDDARAAETQAAAYDRIYLKAAPAGLPWRILGGVQRIEPAAGGLRLLCEHGEAELVWLAPNCLRVRAHAGHGGFAAPFSYAVCKTDWPEVGLTVTEGNDAVLVQTSAAVYRVGKWPLRIGVETPDARLVCMDSLGCQLREDGAVRLALRLHPAETSYGMGERASGLNLRGQRFSLWNTDHHTYKRGSDPLYYSVPFYLGVHDDQVYGVLWDNSNRGSADLGRTQPDELVFEAEAGELCYYLITGGDINSVLSRYTELTGRITLPPAWFLGFQQSRWSYFPQERVLALAQEFRKREIPCDVLYLDIDYMDGYRVFTWDRSRFPSFREMLGALHARGFKAVAILDPGIRIDPDYAAYRSGQEHDVFLKYPDGRLVAGPVWAGMSHFPDFSKPAARAWWAEQCGPLLAAGIDGVWNDMCEPAVFGTEGARTIADYVPHDQEGMGASHLAQHNVYGMLMGRSSLEAQQRFRPDKRPVNMIRAGYAGAQRYAATWTGDNTSDWDHLRLSISMTLNSGLAGAPMTGPDIGGFYGKCDAELLTRWLQAASLLPYYRIHTARGTADQEPWSHGQPYEAINRAAIALRYRLLPYLYSAVALCHEYGWPVVRPVFTAEPDNPKIRSIDDSYLLGDAVLVAPVLEEGAVRRQVYLPAGNWYDFWTNELIAGGSQIEVIAPLERLPLFVRAGTVLPLWPEMQYVGEKPIGTLLLRCYPGEHETVLYEDRGEGMAYEQGDYRWVYMTTAWQGDTLVIERRTAGSYSPEYAAVKLEVVGLDDEPASVGLERQGAPLWFYDAGVLELTVPTFQRIEVTRKPTTTERTLPRKTW